MPTIFAEDFFGVSLFPPPKFVLHTFSSSYGFKHFLLFFLFPQYIDYTFSIWLEIMQVFYNNKIFPILLSSQASLLLLTSHVQKHP